MKQKNILDSSLFSKVCNEFSNISNLITEVINQKLNKQKEMEEEIERLKQQNEELKKK